MPKPSLLLIYGGRSGEHEVSLSSAASVLAALDRKKYDVIPLRIRKDGRWVVGEKVGSGGAGKRGSGGAKRADERYFVPNPNVRRLMTASGRMAERFDVVFPILHGTFGEDGCIQGLFELAEVPYVGSGVLGSSVGMDKDLQKRLLKEAGLPIVRFTAFTAGDWKIQRAEIVAGIESRLRYPCFVKPANLGSSVGISKAHHRRELTRGIEDALTYDTKVVVERAVSDAREIECAVLGGDATAEASVLGEIRPDREFYDYESKYLSGKSKMMIPAPVPKRLADKLRRAALTTFRTLEGHGLGRVDFLIDGSTNEFYVNEINTLPGFTAFSMYPKMWEATGLPYPKLLDRLIALAIERAEAKRQLKRGI